MQDGTIVIGQVESGGRQRRRAVVKVEPVLTHSGTAHFGQGLAFGRVAHVLLGGPRRQVGPVDVNVGVAVGPCVLMTQAHHVDELADHGSSVL